MTVYVVAVSQAEADALAHMIGHSNRKDADQHLRETQAPPTDPFFAKRYKVWAVALSEQE